MFEVDHAPLELSFGRRGEHGEQYQFDFSAWAAELPGGGPGVDGLPHDLHALVGGQQLGRLGALPFPVELSLKLLKK